MSDQQSKSQIVYNYLYHHGLDEKRRIQIPAKWREEVDYTIVLWTKPKEGPCLRVLPPKAMADLMASISILPNSDPGKTVLKRMIGAQSDQVAVDKAGRICIPEEMAKAAGIEMGKEAVLVGMFDKFEIWNSDRYEKVHSADAVLASEALKHIE